jgi:lantibiotic modifying enzyme
MICECIILFFSLLIINSIINKFTKPRIIEGATGTQYQSYKDDPSILANKNASNISILKEQVDKLAKVSDTVSSNTDNIKKNKQVIDSLMQSMTPTTNDASQKNQDYADKNPETFNM